MVEVRHNASKHYLFKLYFQVSEMMAVILMDFVTQWHVFLEGPSPNSLASCKGKTEFSDFFSTLLAKMLISCLMKHSFILQHSHFMVIK